MTGDELSEALDVIGWNAYTMAVKLNMTSDREVRRWLKDQRPIPEPVAEWVRALARAHLDIQPPPKPPINRVEAAA